MGCFAREPGAHDAHMYRGAVSGRAESILRSADASALGNSVQLIEIYRISAIAAETA